MGYSSFHNCSDGGSLAENTLVFLMKFHHVLQFLSVSRGPGTDASV